MTGDGRLIVTVTLATPPVWYEPDYWNTHEFDTFDPVAPYASKPQVTLTSRYDETLGEVIDRASVCLGLALGPAHEKYLTDRVSKWLSRIGFYRPEDDKAFDVHRMYGWPDLLPIARVTGKVETIPWQEATYRELIVSSNLGLIEGDVLRPYISGSMPQGSAHEAVEAAKLTVDAVRHAYALLPQAESVVGGAMQLAFLAGSVKNFRAWRKNRAASRADKKRLGAAIAEARSLGYELVVETYERQGEVDPLRYYAEAAKFTDEVNPVFLGNGLTPGFAASEGLKTLKRRIQHERSAGQTGMAPEAPEMRDPPA